MGAEPTPATDGVTVTTTFSPAGLEAIAELAAARAAELVTEAARSPWMDVHQAAEYLCWPLHKLYKRTRAKSIPCRKVDGRLMFHRDELDGWLDEFRDGPGTRRLASVSPIARGASNGSGTNDP